LGNRTAMEAGSVSSEGYEGRLQRADGWEGKQRGRGRTMGPAEAPLTTAGGGWRWSEFSTERMGRFSFKDGRDIRGNAEGGEKPRLFGTDKIG
jgi:hypothetical protein